MLGGRGLSDIDERVMVQVVDTSKLTAKIVLGMMKSMYDRQQMNHRERQKEKQYRKHQKRQQPKTGKQTLKELMNQNRQLTFVPLEEHADLRALQKELKQYSVDFSVVKEGKSHWQAFFKAQDAEIFNQAFKKVLGKFDPDFQKEDKVEYAKGKEPVKSESKQTSRTQNSPEQPSKRKGSLTVSERLEKAKQEAQAYNQSVQKRGSRSKKRNKKKEVEK